MLSSYRYIEKVKKKNKNNTHFFLCINDKDKGIETDFPEPKQQKSDITMLMN